MQVGPIHDRLARPLVVALAWLMTSSSANAQTQWVASWTAPPTATGDSPGLLPSPLPIPLIQDATVRQVVRLSVGGSWVRVRLTNEFGARPLTIGAASVAASEASVQGQAHRLTFAGRTTATIPAGAYLVSDPVHIRASPLSDIVISLYTQGGAPKCSCHLIGEQSLDLSPAGDWTERAFTPVHLDYSGFRAFLSEVDVEAGPRAHVVVAFGDSITDGYRSSLGGNRRYPDRLAELLRARYGAGAPAVANAGITGNRLLSDGPVVTAGESGLARFDRDVLALPGVTHVIVLEGINDIGDGRNNPPTAEELIHGLAEIVARAHSRGVKVIGATLLPFEGSHYFSTQGEAVRTEVNRWIRRTNAFDAVADFDLLLRDPSHPERIKPELQSGDWLHPNDRGYSIMAEAIPVEVLANWKPMKFRSEGGLDKSQGREPDR